jgi:hypothetical protein
MNLVEFHEPSLRKLRESHAARVLREALQKASKGDDDVRRQLRILMVKAKIKEHAACSIL